MICCNKNSALLISVKMINMCLINYFWKTLIKNNFILKTYSLTDPAKYKYSFAKFGGLLRWLTKLGEIDEGLSIFVRFYFEKKERIQISLRFEV